MDIQATCLDLDGDTEQAITTPPASQYETIYVTSHKGPCRSGTFSPNGGLIATGSADASIKILDVDRMISKSNSHAANQRDNDNSHEHHNQDSNNGHDTVDNNHPNNNNQQQSYQTAHPVIKTLYDHSDEVTYLQFHPTSNILASGSNDMTIKFYDYMRASAKRALKTIQEASPIRSFRFHPCGNYMLVGCQQPTLRLYDVNTLQSYVSSNPLDQHNDAITMIDYNKNGSFYVTGSKDGDIKVWDGISNRCVNTFRRAHESPISSIKVSRNGKYILSAGKEVKLWEMSMFGCLMTYEGSNGSSNAQAIFNHTEEYVLFPDGRTNLHCWDARNGRHQDVLPLCHNNSVRFIAHSDVSGSMLTCSEDFRARFWSAKETETKINQDN